MLLRKSYSWWWDSHNSSRRSPWLQSTLSELDVKTKAMLQLIEEDADSFAQRAEMYYKKRPELVNMVEDFYRAHRSLAERYDQLKSDLGNRYPEPIFSIKNLSSKSSEVSDSFDSEESEVDDPEPEEAQDDPEPEETQIEGCKNRGNSSIICSAIQVETCTNCENNIRFDGEETQVDECENKENSARFDSETQVKECKNRENGARIDCETQVEECKNTGNGPGVEVSIEEIDSELAEVRKEIERLREENRALRAELEEKNEDKREVIRQLCLSVEMLKEEKASLRKCIKDSKKWSLFEFYKWKGVFSGNLFNGFAMFQPGMVTL